VSTAFDAVESEIERVEGTSGKERGELESSRTYSYSPWIRSCSLLQAGRKR